MIAIVFKNLWCRVRDTFVDMYKGGIGNLIAEKRYFKAIIDICLIIGFGYLIVNFGNSMSVGLISIGMMMTILNRITATDDSFIIIDVTKPFLTIAMFSMVSVLYSFIRETAVFTSVLVIPLMTNQVEERVRLYYKQLTPCKG